MALLKDTLILGSARITDTLYATNINGSTITAPIYWENSTALPEKASADYFLAIDAFASGGKTYFVKAANVLSSIGAVKAITSTDNNIPRFDSTGGLLLSSRMSINDNGLISLSYNGLYPGDVLYSNAAGLVGESWLDTGHATNVTSPRFYWRVRRPKSTAATTTETVYEQFRLPAATAGTEASKTYEIITTKNLSNITSVGTITSGTWQGTAIAAAYIGAHNHAAGDINSGTLGVARGGTGAGTFTDECIIVGNGTNALESRGLKVTGAAGADTTITPADDKALNIGTNTSSTLYLNRKTAASIIFKRNGTEEARFNLGGSLQLGDTNATLTTYKLYAAGAIGLNGKLAFNTNITTENAYILYDSTLHTLNFSVT